ncbi:potassium sodium hyperpolarization-activated cyclic nucleotide-gated channel 4 [Schistosoma japonicum]|nr:potassium sodium hyperpolarization-activated cyclic nucleotide-gated channel 4 [Schistosoma japonicum]
MEHLTVDLKQSCELLKDDNLQQFTQGNSFSSFQNVSRCKSNDDDNNNNNSNLVKGDLMIDNSKLTAVSTEDVRRQSSVHSDQTLHVGHQLYPTTSLSHTASAFSSYLRIPSIYDQVNDITVSTHSADWSKSLHRLSCFNTPESLDEEYEKFTQATVRAVLAASARQSRTALTDLPLEFFTNTSNLSKIDSKLNSLSVQQLSNRHLSTETTLNANRLNLPLGKFYDECKERQTNRKFSSLCTHSLDDTIHDSVLLYNRDKSPTILRNSNNIIFDNTNNPSNFTHLTLSSIPNKNAIITTMTNTSTTITTSKQNLKSFKHLARQTSHSIHRPLKRLAASFRLTKPTGYSSSIQYKQHSRNNVGSSWNSVVNCIDSLQDHNDNNNNTINNEKNLRTRSVILQTDHDFLNEIKREKGLRKGHLLLNDNEKRLKTELSESTDHETDSLLSQDDKPSGSFHLKRTIFCILSTNW